MNASIRIGTWTLVTLALAGCRSGPRDFRDVNNAAPLLRAQAAGLDGEVPDSVAIPDLIRRLDDADAVVRLSAHEALRRRTGLDLGYVPWSDDAERAEGSARWRAWWESTGGRPIRPSPQAALAGAGRLP